MVELKNKIIIIIEEFQVIVDLLYKQKKDEAYKKINVTIPTFANIINELHQYSLENTKYEFNVNKLVSALTECLDAMEKNDLTLLADVLNYEVIEQLNVAKKL